jgi:hypothetical protein
MQDVRKKCVALKEKKLLNNTRKKKILKTSLYHNSFTKFHKNVKDNNNFFFLIEEYQKYKKKDYDNELIQNIVDKVRKQSQSKEKNLNFGKISKKKLQKHNMCT